MGDGAAGGGAGEGYSLDLVIDWHGERLAIEVDGPSHFSGREPTGATLLKRRQLKHLGWRLVSVPYWERDERTHQDQSMAHRQRAAYVSTLLSPEAPTAKDGLTRDQGVVELQLYKGVLQQRTGTVVVAHGRASSAGMLAWVCTLVTPSA